MKDSLITGAKISSGVIESSHLADSLELASIRLMVDSTHYWDANVNGIGYDLQFVYNEQDTFTVYKTDSVIVNTSDTLSSAAYRYGILAY